MISSPYENLGLRYLRVTSALRERMQDGVYRDYQQNLERMIAEHTEQLEQRLREMMALNRLLQEHLHQHPQVVAPGQ
jgi:hypothetical protein